MRHICHKAGVTNEGNFTSVLSHKDPNTKTGVNRERRVQQISLIKQTNKHKNSSSKIGGADSVGALLGGA
jgi:hypothetical protein